MELTSFEKYERGLALEKEGKSGEEIAKELGYKSAAAWWTSKSALKRKKALLIDACAPKTDNTPKPAVILEGLPDKAVVATANTSPVSTAFTQAMVKATVLHLKNSTQKTNKELLTPVDEDGIAFFDDPLADDILAAGDEGLDPDAPQVVVPLMVEIRDDLPLTDDLPPEGEQDEVKWFRQLSAAEAGVDAGEAPQRLVTPDAFLDTPPWAAPFCPSSLKLVSSVYTGKTGRYEISDGYLVMDLPGLESIQRVVIHREQLADFLMEIFDLHNLMEAQS